MWAALLVLLALAQEPASVTTQVFEVSGKVDRVNRSARTVTVLPAGAAGVASAPIYVGPDLAIFDSVKAGDFVVVRYTTVHRRTDARQKNGSAEDPGRPRAGWAEDGRRPRAAGDTAHRDDRRPRPDAMGSVTYHGSDNRRVFRVVQIASCWKG